jgi:DNA repair protein SbcC/Rad50
MKLKKITLNNIRSYKQQEIEFGEGSILLAGDIGSGKTSILLGIEFALFGLQPGQKGASLLRNGEDSGGVAIEFEIEGKEIIIERTLKRGKAISQDYCSISINGEKSETSVMELKNKILDILEYPKEFSKKQNILYKFTVYTPQEEMKQIILQDPKTRINTLRHVFGIDKYKKILENTSVLTSKLREEKRINQALTIDFEKDKEEIVSKESELESKRYNLVSIEKELFLKKENRKKTEEEKQDVYKKIEEKIKLNQEIEKTKIIVSNKNESISENKRRIDLLQKEIDSFGTVEFSQTRLENLDREISRKTMEKEDLRDKNLEITTQINSIVIKNSENEKVKINLGKIDLCPTCLQDVDPIYKSNVFNKLDSEVSQNVSKVQNLETEKHKIVEDTNKIKREILSLEEQKKELGELRFKFQKLEDTKKRILELEENNLTLLHDSDFLNKHLEDLKNSVFELKKFDNLFNEKQKQLEEAWNQEKIAEIKVAELKIEIEVFSRQIQELKEKIQKSVEIKKRLGYISELEDWLSKKFTPVISFIEKNVMIKLQTEFSQLLGEWFKMLVSDSFNVRLSDDFSPIIEYQDYEIDYEYLSGGERTAVALAYRLALNQVINSLLSKIKTRDLIILDEPTDGFSEQQLDKMRDVLQQLNVGQLIIVSHEQKIEGFVENLIRFKKIGGVSEKEEA